MLKERWISHFSYLAVGLASLILAVYVASTVIKPAQSQESEGDGEVAEDQSIEEAPTIREPISGPGALVNTPQNNNSAVSPVPPGISGSSPAGSPPATPTSSDPVPVNPNLLPQAVSFLEPYVYDTREGRRNPFRPPLLADGSLPDVVLPGTPLERYELDELKVAAIMWDVKSPRAMIIDPQGEVHMLRKDDRIGRKRGYIAAIREGEVVVVESALFNGENTFSTRIMRIDK